VHAVHVREEHCHSLASYAVHAVPTGDAEDDVAIDVNDLVRTVSGAVTPSATDHLMISQMPDLTTTAGVQSGERAFAMSGLSPSEIDVVTTEVALGGEPIPLAGAPVDAPGAAAVLDARANPVKHARVKTSPDDGSHRPLTGGRQIEAVDSNGYAARSAA